MIIEVSVEVVYAGEAEAVAVKLKIEREDLYHVVVNPRLRMYIGDMEHRYVWDEHHTRNLAYEMVLFECKLLTVQIAVRYHRAHIEIHVGVNAEFAIDGRRQ